MTIEKNDFTGSGDEESAIDSSSGVSEQFDDSVDSRPYTKREVMGMALLGTAVVGIITVILPLSDHYDRDRIKDDRLEAAESELEQNASDDERERDRETDVILQDQEERRQITAKVKSEYLSQPERNFHLANSLATNGQRLIDAYKEGLLPGSVYEGYDPNPEDGLREEKGQLYGKVGKYNYTINLATKNDEGDLVLDTENPGMEVIDTDSGLVFQITGAPKSEWAATENNPDLTGIWSVALSEIAPSEGGFPEFDEYSNVPFATSEDYIAGWSNPSVYEIWSPEDEAALNYPGGAKALDNAVTGYLSEFGNAVTYVGATNK